MPRKIPQHSDAKPAGVQSPTPEEVEAALDAMEPRLIAEEQVADRVQKKGTEWAIERMWPLYLWAEKRPHHRALARALYAAIQVQRAHAETAAQSARATAHQAEALALAEEAQRGKRARRQGRRAQATDDLNRKLELLKSALPCVNRGEPKWEAALRVEFGSAWERSPGFAGKNRPGLRAFEYLLAEARMRGIL